MRYKLNADYSLRGWQRLPNALVDTKSARVTFISSQEMSLLKMCDGSVDLDLPLIPENLRQMVPAFLEHGIIEECSDDERCKKEQSYHVYPSRFIRQAHWSVTGKCNYRCRHCYMSAPEGRMGELDHETILRIVDELAECGIFRVSLTGGEPLVRQDFLSIVDALTERGIAIDIIYSNGKLVSDELLDELTERGLKPEFNMSYDGAGWHDWLRGVAGAEQTIETAFKRCRDHGFPTGAEMCLHSKNADTLQHSVLNLASWGCQTLKTNPISDVGAWKEGGYGPSLSLHELYSLYLRYIPQYYKDSMPLQLQLGGFFWASPKDPDSFRIPLAKDCVNPEQTCLCGHARNVLYISAQGRALPCMSLSGMDIQREFPLITEVGLVQCLTDSRYMRFIDTRVPEYMAANPTCATCDWSTVCIGGCRAAALESNPADPLGPDLYACELFRGGWVSRIIDAVKSVRPGAKLRGLPEDRVGLILNETAC